MVQGLPCGQEVDWWALGIIMYAMMTGRFPFSDPDQYMLHHKIKYREVKYQTGISKEAELIMRGVSIINIKTGTACARVGLPCAFLFPGHVLFLRPQNFLPCWFFKILWDVKLFLTLCCFLNCSHVVLGLKCKNFILRKYIIVIYFHCLCQKTSVKWLTFCISEECCGPKL